MSPTIFREGPFRFFFFSREELRPHVHVQSNDGEAKYWLDPEVELARSVGLKNKEIKRIETLITVRRQEILDAWNSHFGS